MKCFDWLALVIILQRELTNFPRKFIYNFRNNFKIMFLMEKIIIIFTAKTLFETWRDVVQCLFLNRWKRFFTNFSEFFKLYNERDSFFSCKLLWMLHNFEGFWKNSHSLIQLYSSAFWNWKCFAFVKIFTFIKCSSFVLFSKYFYCDIFFVFNRSCWNTFLPP